MGWSGAALMRARRGWKTLPERLFIGAILPREAAFYQNMRQAKFQQRDRHCLDVWPARLHYLASPPQARRRKR
jgi:hypothetical protein